MVAKVEISPTLSLLRRPHLPSACTDSSVPSFRTLSKSELTTTPSHDVEKGKDDPPSFHETASSASPVTAALAKVVRIHQAFFSILFCSYRRAVAGSSGENSADSGNPRSEQVERRPKWLACFVGTSHHVPSDFSISHAVGFAAEALGTACYVWAGVGATAAFQVTSAAKLPGFGDLFTVRETDLKKDQS